MRFVAVLGQDIYTPIGLNEPNLNLARQAGFAARRGEVEELSVGFHSSKPMVAMPCLETMDVWDGWADYRIGGEERMSSRRAAFLRPSITERLFNHLFGVLVGWGIGLPHNYLVQVEGRKTGRIYSTPVDVLDHDGKRFLVAPRGETQWVRNARVSGRVLLKKGRFRQRFALRELNDHEKPEILREYLNRFKTTVQRYFPVPAGSPLEAFSSIVPQYPVFELVAE